MAAIDHVEITPTQLSMATVRGQDAKDFIRLVIAGYMWGWYKDNLQKHVYTVSLFRGLIRHKIYVKDLHPLFTLLFGPRP